MKIIKPFNSDNNILVDDFNYERLKNLRISDSNKNLVILAYNNITWATIPIPLTKIILLTDAEVVDHIDRNYLNNQVYNLRPCTSQQNNFNKGKRKGHYYSNYKGVTYDKIKSRWIARIKVNGKSIFLGLFYIENDAAEAYNEASRKYHKEFGFINIIK